MNPIVSEPQEKSPKIAENHLQHLEQLIIGHGRIMEMISGGEDLHKILNAIVHWAEKESSEGLRASILLTNYNGENLLHGAAPSLHEDYNNAVHGIAIGDNMGSCGTAAFTKELVIASDIDTDIRWTHFRQLALKHGLRACWSSPIISKTGKVLGTFAMYYDHPKLPTDHDLSIIKLITNTAVIAIEWTRAQEERTTLLATEQLSIQKIREERSQFYHLLMNAPAMVAVLKGREHVFELANPIYMQAVGPHRQVLGKPVREALPEVVEQGFIDILDGVYDSGEPFYGNEVPIRLDKKQNAGPETAFFNFIYNPIRSDSGKTEGIFVHAVDITELVVAKKRSEESEKRFRSFVLNSPSPIGIYVGREMRIQTANDAVLKAWEKDKSVIGKTFREALPELEGQPYYDILDKVYTTGIPYEANEERVLLMRNGELAPTYWNFSYTPLRNEFDEIYGVMNTATEVTELVTAKKQLLAAEETLRSAIGIAELGTWQINLETGLVTYDDRIIDWFGLPENGTDLETVISRLDPSHRERVAAAVSKAIETHGMYDAEYTVLNPHSQKERMLHARGKVIMDEAGRPMLLNGICRDITLQKQTEKELARQVEERTYELQKANEELNTVNDNLKQFVYVASHDLQEPLRKIHMFSDILKKKTVDSPDPSTNVYLNKISQASRRMTALIKDLLEFSRAESNEHSFSAVDLSAVVRNIIEDYEVLIQQKSAYVDVSSLPVIRAIPLQMNQLFFNLVGNALKFSRPGVAPHIRIDCREMSPAEVARFDKLEPGRQYARISISDNGIGFDQKFAEQIFVIFQRLHARDEFEGTGIGLALCKKIAENHDGIIYAEGRETEGATFNVILPVNN